MQALRFNAHDVLWIAPVLSADRIRIGVSNYNVSNLTVGVAHTGGFFAQEGIDAEIIRMNPNVATMALVSGDIDYSTLIGSLIGTDLRGAKLKMIACSQDRTPLSIIGNAKLKTVRDIRGKTIGVGSYGSTPDMIAHMVAKHYGIDPETEIKLLALGSDGARLTALKEGVVDAIIVSPPVDFEAKKLGFSVLTRAGDILRFPYNGLGATVKKLNEKPEEIKRVIRAIVKANGFIRRDREGAVDVLIRWTRTKREFAEAAYDSTVNVFSRDGSIPEEGLKLLIENLRKSMNVSRSIPFSQVADSTILFSVQRELGLRN